ncbi:hypothetical protein GCM10023238_12730 [Streptomyces heliomycini]
MTIAQTVATSSGVILSQLEGGGRGGGGGREGGGGGGGEDKEGLKIEMLYKGGAPCA